MEGKNVIYFYRDWWDFLEDLDMQQRGEWITYVMQYVNDLNPDLPNDKQVMSICKITRNQLKRDLEDWKKSIEKKSEAGKKGMASRWGIKENITNDNNVITSDNNVITTNNVKDIVKDKDKVKVIDKDIEKDTHNIYACEEESINTLQSLIQEIETLFNRCLTNAETITLQEFKNKGMSNESIIRDLKTYSDKEKPISYMKKMIENAMIQERVYKQEEQPKIEEEKKPSGSKWLDDFKAKLERGEL